MSTSTSWYWSDQAGIGGLASVLAMESGFLHQRTAVCGGGDLDTGLLAPLLPPRPHIHLQTEEEGIDDHGDGVLQRRRGDCERGVLEQVTRADLRPDENFVGAPSEFVARVREPLVGDHAVREE